MSEREAGPMVGDKHLMAWVSETLQAAGAEQEDPICGLLVECVLIARGNTPHREYLADVIERATKRYARALAAMAEEVEGE